MPNSACPKYDCSYIFHDWQVFNWSNPLLYANFSRAPPLEPNPDISGIGVIAAFLVPACIAYTFVLGHYIFTPDYANCNSFDRAVLGLFRKRFPRAMLSKKWSIGIKKLVLSFSDQQILTSIAILSSGISQLKCGLSAYHWQIVVYLSWFSSVTHLSTLTLLEDYFHHCRPMRYLRVSLMLLLLGMLVYGMVPTGCALWLYMDTKWDNKPYNLGSIAVDSLIWSNFSGVPAQCYLEAAHAVANRKFDAHHYFQAPLYMKSTSSATKSAPKTATSSQFSNMVFSSVLITMNYVHRASRISPSISGFISKSINRRANDLRKSLYRRLSRSLKHGIESSGVSIVLDEGILRIFIAVYAIYELVQSYIFELLWLIFAITWGCSRIFAVRESLGSSVVVDINEENFLGFGQVLCCGLLLLSALATFELFYDVENKVDPTISETATQTQDSEMPHREGPNEEPHFQAPSRDQDTRSLEILGDIGLEHIEMLSRASTGISIGTEERTLGLLQRPSTAVGLLNDNTGRGQQSSARAFSRDANFIAQLQISDRVRQEHLSYAEDFHNFKSLASTQFVVAIYLVTLGCSLLVGLSVDIKKGLFYYMSQELVYDILNVSWLLFAHVDHCIFVEDFGESPYLMIARLGFNAVGFRRQSKYLQDNSKRVSRAFVFILSSFLFSYWGYFGAGFFYLVGIGIVLTNFITRGILTRERAVIRA